MSPLACSIVVAATDASGTTEDERTPPWFEALVREARVVGAELLVAGDLGAGQARLVAFAASQAVPLSLLTAPASALAPHLWGLGLRAARGDAVAFTINQCTVQRGWGAAVLAGISAGDAGVGGRIVLGGEASRTARAIYFLRYSAFLGRNDAPREQVPDIAGDNAAYRRDVLLRTPSDHGFWEIEAHHRIRADGETLALIPGMSAEFGGAPHLGSFMRQRFRHGRHFGAWRVRNGGRRPWQMALSSPLVPFVLLLRTARRVSGTPGGISGLAGCVVPFLALGAAWAAGEAAGAFEPRDASAPHGR